MAKRVVQVEQIFRDIENMCFLRTGEGMKSVMKTELTVVEAIMQVCARVLCVRMCVCARVCELSPVCSGRLSTPLGKLLCVRA